MSATTQAATEAEAEQKSFLKSPLGLILILSLIALLAAIVLFKDSILGMKPQAEVSESGNIAAPAIETAQTGYYVIADSNVRDKPTAEGSIVVDKLPRGTKVSGAMEMGADGTSQWFKLADGSGYVGAINLSTKTPPNLLKIFNNLEWPASRPVEIRALPDVNSAVVSTSPQGTILTLAGITDTGFAEAKLPKGGVGYFLAAGLTLEAAKPIDIALKPSSCDFGQDVDAIFSALAAKTEKETGGDASIDDAEKSRFLATSRAFKGLSVTGVGSHYEASSIYFADSPGEVMKIFKGLGFKVDANGNVSGEDEGGATTSIFATNGEEARIGKTALTCGV